MFFGLVLVIVGGILLLESMGVITGDAWRYIWPILIILLGLSILFKPFRSKLFRGNKWGWDSNKDENKEENK